MKLRMNDTDRRLLEELRDIAGTIVANAITLLGDECESQEEAEEIERSVESDCQHVRELADDLWVSGWMWEEGR
ncbi:hypothetical protein LCGC14_0698560 [marine sediment metagenome]|uniref:PhoU domain-containing protein n=1 Tax=marine sediment metagenome TaxID=412755 RepID=A0A0F9R3W2_9ZZZZ